MGGQLGPRFLARTGPCDHLRGGVDLRLPRESTFLAAVQQLNELAQARHAWRPTASPAARQSRSWRPKLGFGPHDPHCAACGASPPREGCSPATGRGPASQFSCHSWLASEADAPPRAQAHPSAHGQAVGSRPAPPLPVDRGGAQLTPSGSVLVAGSGRAGTAMKPPRPVRAEAVRAANARRLGRRSGPARPLLQPRL